MVPEEGLSRPTKSYGGGFSPDIGNNETEQLSSRNLHIESVYRQELVVFFNQSVDENPKNWFISPRQIIVSSY
jgi:hypothetical protein